ncbi:MAG: cob(I)yrinic acid a,c-diamide adenosyltransferase [Methanomassiliicoccales archaeon]|nr:cob(I)yrinic acid a,c-diamide adenosyltransferase [Methanomassiliicoccales archaeon]
MNDRSIDVKVVLTGRCAPSELLAVADYITEMKALRHPYEKGTLSREGVDR